MDEAKENLINQIRNMDSDTFLNFQDVLGDFQEELKPFLDLSFMFTCEKCKGLYGACDEEVSYPSECYKRYEKYTQSSR